MWVTFTKDKLVRKNWNRNISCAFSVARMKQFSTCFFDCLYAKFLWCAVYIVLGLRLSLDGIDLFHRWYKQGRGINKSLMLIGGVAICFAKKKAYKEQSCFLKNANLKLFTGLVNGNALVTTWGAPTIVS
jgi:hypothetical protein